MLEKARARGKDLVQRQTGLLQSDCPQKSNIEVWPPPGDHSVRVVVQRFHGIERAKLASRVYRELDFCLDPPRHDRLMIPVVYDQHGTSGETVGKLGLEPVPGHRGLCEPGVVLSIVC